MPDIDTVAPVFYDGLDPYHVNFDNLPIKNIIRREDIINDAVDLNTSSRIDAAGTAGTVAARLATSLNGNGNLISSSIDTALHNIGAHTDGSYDDGDGLIAYVRMKQTERDKLTLIADEATSLKIQYTKDAITTIFDNDTIELMDSDTVTWEIDAPNKLLARMAFPVSAAHSHYYNIVPITVDFTYFRTTVLNTRYISDSLRVYVNGTRLNTALSVYIPPHTGPSGIWRQVMYTETDNTTGLFNLNIELDPLDIVIIDFDSSLA